MSRLTVPLGASVWAGVNALRVDRTCNGRWQALRRTVDLGDVVGVLGSSARLGRARHRLALAQALGIAAKDATAVRIAETLTARAKTIERECLNNAEVAQLLALLGAQVGSVGDATADLRAATTLKELARSGPPIGANAQLRLVIWCQKAFHRAALAPAQEQQLLLNQCLYPHFDSDPVHYFAENPAERPIDPPWTLLARMNDRALQALQTTRFAAVAQWLRDENREFLVRVRAHLPSAARPRSLKTPHSAAGIVLPRLPVFAIAESDFLIDSAVVAEDDPDLLTATIRRRSPGGAPGAILLARPNAKMSRVFILAKAAHRAGLRRLYLGVLRKTAAKAPVGGAHRMLWPDGAIRRLEGIPVSLRHLHRSKNRRLRRRPRRLDEVSRSSVHIGLVIEAGMVRLFSRHGRAQAVSLDKAATQIDRAHQSYPGQSVLIVSPRADTTYGAFFRLAERARIDERGESVFAAIALQRMHRLNQSDNDLDSLLTLLQRARVRLTNVSGEAPEAALIASATRCFRDALARSHVAGRSPPVGRLGFATRPLPRVTGRGVSDKPLRTCVLQALGRLVDLASAVGPRRYRGVVEFSLPGR